MRDEERRGKLSEGRRTLGRLSVGLLGSEKVRVRVGLSSGDRLGGDKDLGGREACGGDGLGRVEEGGRRADGPSLLSVPLSGSLGQLGEERLDSGEGNDSLSSGGSLLLGGGEDGLLESDHLSREELLVLNQAPLPGDEEEERRGEGVSDRVDKPGARRRVRRKARSVRGNAGGGGGAGLNGGG